MHACPMPPVQSRVRCCAEATGSRCMPAKRSSGPQSTHSSHPAVRSARCSSTRPQLTAAACKWYCQFSWSTSKCCAPTDACHTRPEIAAVYEVFPPHRKFLATRPHVVERSNDNGRTKHQEDERNRGLVDKLQRHEEHQTFRDQLQTGVEEHVPHILSGRVFHGGCERRGGEIDA